MIFANALCEKLNEAWSQKEIHLSTPENGLAKSWKKLWRLLSEFFPPQIHRLDGGFERISWFKCEKLFYSMF